MDGEFVKNNQKIGVFGGTFDPVHEGHVGLAEFVIDQDIVDSILFLPAAHPPHKSRAVAPFSHRVAMLETAISARPEMAVSSLESRRHGPSYTVDSLRALQLELSNSRLFFLLGADSLLELHLWYNFTELFTLAELVVVPRPGLADELCYRALKALPGNFTSDPGFRIWSRADKARIWYLTGFSSLVSSSKVRQQLDCGLLPQGVDQAVLSYIRKHHLYGQGENCALHS